MAFDGALALGARLGGLKLRTDGAAPQGKTSSNYLGRVWTRLKPSSKTVGRASTLMMLAALVVGVAFKSQAGAGVGVGLFLGGLFGFLASLPNPNKRSV